MSPSPRLATREEQRITQLELERDSLRDQLTRLQQEVAELKATLTGCCKHREVWKGHDCIACIQEALTRLQQDVKPLLGLADSDDPAWKMKTLDTFLTSHPECKP